LNLQRAKIYPFDKVLRQAALSYLNAEIYPIQNFKIFLLITRHMGSTLILPSNKYPRREYIMPEMLTYDQQSYAKT
jgi:hypothetical protein